MSASAASIHGPWDDLVASKKEGATYAAVAQLAELVAALGAPPLPGRPTASIDVCLGDARSALRDALTTAGLTEYRAMVTADPGDAAKHAEALAVVDAAYATLWAYEAAGAKIRVHDVEVRRADLLARLERQMAKKRAAMAMASSSSSPSPDLNRLIDELRQTHRELSELTSPTEAEVRLPRPLGAVALGTTADDPPLSPPSPQKKERQQQAVRKRLRQNGRIIAAAAAGGGGVANGGAGHMRVLRARVPF